MIKTFLEPLNGYGEFNNIKEALKAGKTPIGLSGMIEGQRAHMLQALGEDYKYRVVIASDDMTARRIAEEWQMFDENVLFYPSKDFIFYQADIQGKQLVRERMRVLENLILGKDCTIVCSVDAGMDKRQELSVYKDATITINGESIVDLKKFENKLLTMGYERQARVENEGEFAIQGGIIDVYPICAPAPFRIELWDDEVDTIRTFDAASQRSIENVESVVIFPATENIYSKEEIAKGLKKLKAEAEKQSDKFREVFKTEEAARVRRQIKELEENIEYMYYSVNLDSYVNSFCAKATGFFNYFSDEETIFFVVDPQYVDEHGKAAWIEYDESMASRLEKGYVLPSQVDAIFDFKKVMANLSKRRTITAGIFNTKNTIKPRESFSLNATSIAPFHSNFKELVKEVAAYKKKGYRTLIVSASRTRAKRVAADLCDYEVNAFYSDDPDRVVQPKEIMVVAGNLQKGFEYPLIKFVVISESDIFGVKKNKKKKQKIADPKELLAFNKLKDGDYVIHENHGMGIYRGLFKIQSDGVEKDYIKLEYGGGDILYVPVTALNIIQKYQEGSEEGRKPRLARLNSVEWHNTKASVRASVNEIAEDLVELYAKRQTVKGFKFDADNVWQNEFEEMFPYEETDDQLKAINDTKADMESTRIMDRLICGDVGYGKTEVALRAAFKAVQDSKQVAILVPTTILAQQHYNTFVQRLKEFPVTVDILSRFRTAAEQRETLKNLRTGQLDIVIGTHRLLSKDVQFKDLGLLVVDEEQRFGVTHKEKIKKLKNSVDVLTLSATPIPRTMHMSLIGIRDMSILDEPPVDRMPIQTYVLEHNDELIREAILREMARGGQVYYVNNRIAGIEDVAANLQQMLPEASIEYAHGRMNEKQLEDIMMRFVNGDLDVLVSTTIIETGMDIPNVNTIIIDDAERFGLSQLYQLRGRVGRSNRTAYAFLMYRKNKILKEEAEKRLSAIKEFTELGAGHKIAMRDLEIRGAGNLLGKAQSGHMSAVGYELYCKMLNDAVKKAKGEEVVEDFETSIDLETDAFIPAKYISNEMTRLDLYKQISAIETEEDLSEMRDELSDRFGGVPKEVDVLLESSLIRSLAHKVYVADLKQKGDTLTLVMYPQAKLDVAKFGEFIAAGNGKIKLINGANPKFVVKVDNQNVKTLITEVKSILNSMQELLIK